MKVAGRTLDFPLDFVRAALFALAVPLLLAVRDLFGLGTISRLVQSGGGFFLIQTLRLFGASVGRGLSCKRGLFIDNALGSYANLRIGRFCYLGPQAFFDLAREITLEDEVVLSPEVMILTHGDVGDRFLRAYVPRKEGPVLLEKGCWIGARAIILPGVTVGSGAIVGAGAVVTRDVEPLSVVAGVPARELKRLDGKLVCPPILHED